MNTIICTFRGRIDPGKGIDLLIEILPKLIKQSQHQRQFHIFGTGSLTSAITQLSSTYPQVQLYGRATRDQIKPIAQSGHYCFCPSQLLESFGMTALEGCKIGLPVIGPYKGGLQQFIITDFSRFDDISLDGQSLMQLLLYIDQHHDQFYLNRQQETINIASSYGPDHWLNTLKTLLSNNITKLSQ